MIARGHCQHCGALLPYREESVTDGEAMSDTPPFVPEYVDIDGERVGLCSHLCPHLVSAPGHVDRCESAPALPETWTVIGTPCRPWLVFTLKRQREAAEIAQAQCARAQEARTHAVLALSRAVQPCDHCASLRSEWTP